MIEYRAKPCFPLHRERGRARPPAETLAELAQRTGTPQATLRRRFAKTGGGVAEAFRARGRIYYVKSELDLWAEREAENV